MFIKYRMKSLCIWEAPRSFGTVITYALHNGLRHQGVASQLVDEPFSHYRTEPIFKKGGQAAVNAYLHDCVHAPRHLIEENACIIQKRIARRLYDPRGHIDLDTLGWDWMTNFQHAFLIRDPSESMASYSHVRRKKYDKPHDNPLGLDTLCEVFDRVRDVTGVTPHVFESPNLLKNPEKGMSHLSECLELSYSEHMIQWDSVDIEPVVWADKWYETLVLSEGIVPYTPRKVSLNEAEKAVVESQRPYYDRLRKHALLCA